MSIADFINQYFIEPVVFSQGYNWINTTAFAILAMVIVYLTFRLLKRLKVSIDKRFALAISPYVIFGSVFRVLEDSGVITSYLMKSPMIWIEIFFLTVFLVLISLIAQKKFRIPYFKILFIIGTIMVAISLSFLHFVNFRGFGLVVGCFSPWVLIFYLIKWKEENKMVTLIHGFDATTTFVATQFFGYQELHVLSRFLISSFTPVSFIFIKIIAVIIFLVLIDRFSQDKQFNNWLKIAIGIFGAGPAIRDLIRLLVFV
jgi:uncharacterized membrane protein